ncbi:MAG: DUF4340 domain-containing protein [Candidatus Kapabacteria bacterium]|nr:DUF4340 domain-containing protein [Candidatus Kapabacteria bacterium]
MLLLRNTDERNLTAQDRKFFVKLDSIKLNKYIIKNKNGTFILKKETDGWFIVSPIHYRVDSIRLESLLRMSSRMYIKSEVTENASNFHLFNLDSNAMELQIFEDSTLKIHLLAGKPGPDFTATHVRLKGDNKIVLLNGTWFYTLNGALKDWQNRTIFAVDTSKLSEIKFKVAGEDFSCKKIEGKWMIGSLVAVPDKIKDILSALTNYETDFFLKEAPTLLPEKYDEIKFETLSIRFYRLDNERFLVKTSQTSQWFMVLASKAGKVLYKKDELLKED